MGTDRTAPPQNPLPLAGEGRVRVAPPERARELRRESTNAERALWQDLRGRRFAGFKFRRQRPIGKFIVDFVCLERRLIIELDGGQHAEQAEYDARRSAALERLGYQVSRFWNVDVLGDRADVLDTIDRLLRPDPHPNPLPQAGEGAGERDRAKRERMAKARVVAPRTDRNA
jgi:adenine-specific DNA-methyltransferase